MFDDYDEKIEKARVYHEAVEKAYVKGFDEVRFEGYFKMRPIDSFTKIISALYNHGGGMTKREIMQYTGLDERELNLRLKIMTEGVDIHRYQRAVAEVQLKPVADLVYQEHLGNVPPEAFEINENYKQDPILDEQYGRYYLWCQKDGKEFRQDIYGRYGGIDPTIDKDQVIIESFDVEAHNAEYNKLTAEKERLTKELEQLGMFDILEKKKLHASLDECEEELKKRTADATAYSNALAEIKQLIKDMETIK